MFARRKENTWREISHGLDGEEMRQLSTYNTEAYRGLVHTPEWSARMKQLQEKFDSVRTR